MRFGGNTQGGSNHDFSHLETNPNYKQGEGEEGVATNEESTNEPSESAGEVVNENISNETAETVTETITESNNEPVTETTNEAVNETDDFKLTDELLFKTLSEQLGRQINSLDDLQQKSEELNPHLKEINEWSKKTGRPIEDFFKYQKNYDDVSDMDIAREFLQLKYPMFDEKELEYKMKSMLPSEDDLEEDSIQKNIELKMFASEARNHFNSLKQELSEVSPNSLTDEIKYKVESFDKIQEDYKHQQSAQKSYYEGLVNASTASDKVKLNLSDDFSVDFKINENDRKSIPDFINSMPHWKQENGEWNHEAVVQDAYKIKYFDNLIKLAYEQGFNSGQSDVVKQQNNITLDNTNNSNSTQDTGKTKPIIENIDKLLGKQGLKFRF